MNFWKLSKSLTITKRAILLGVFVMMGILTQSCDAKKTSLVATITGAGGFDVSFESFTPFNGSSGVAIKTAKADANGNFKMIFDEILQPGIYQIKLGQSSAFLILQGREKAITLKSNLNDLKLLKFKTTGTPLTAQFSSVLAEFQQGKIDIEAGKKKVIDAKLDPLVSTALATFLMPKSEFADVHEKVSKRLAEKYPNIALSQQYSQFSEEINTELAKQQSKARIAIGSPAPDLVFEDPAGKTRRLSDLKGKLVLLDFWASWCGPCRMANPHVVEMYQKYKDKGFDIFSVSLDGLTSRDASRMDESGLANYREQSKQRWINAISQDGLVWENHVSDLKKWESKAAAIYGVSSIPSTFLIDKEGKIVAINPRGNLEEQIKANL